MALIEILDADENWLPRYVEWELGLLNQLGYGLDLTECAAGSTDDLVFVSLDGVCGFRRCRCAVQEKLFDLPTFFMTSDPAPMSEDIHMGLRITGHFLRVAPRTPMPAICRSLGHVLWTRWRGELGIN